MSDPKILSEDEANWVERPEGFKPWFWSEPINAMTSDSYRIPMTWTDKLETFEHVIRCLYRSGFGIVAISPKAQERLRNSEERREREYRDESA